MDPSLLSFMESIHLESLVSMATAAEDDLFTVDTCPETLMLDVRHLRSLRQEFACLVTLAAMLTTARAHITASGEIGDLGILDQMSGVLYACETPPKPVFARNLAAMLNQTSLCESRRGILARLLEQTMSPEDAVHKIL